MKTIKSIFDKFFILSIVLSLAGMYLWGAASIAIIMGVSMKLVTCGVFAATLIWEAGERVYYRAKLRRLKQMRGIKEGNK